MNPLCIVCKKEVDLLKPYRQLPTGQTIIAGEKILLYNRKHPNAQFCHIECKLPQDKIITETIEES